MSFSGSIWGPPRPNKKRKEEDDKQCGDCMLCEERRVDNGSQGHQAEGNRCDGECEVK